MAKQPEPIGKPRRMYVVRLEAIVDAVVVARSEEDALAAVDFDNWTPDPDFYVADSHEITTRERAEEFNTYPDLAADCLPDSQVITDKLAGELIDELLEEQRQAKIEAEFRAKQIPLLDSCGSSR